MAMNKDALQKKLQGEVEVYQDLQKELNKFVEQRQRLDGQLNENKCVSDELNILGSDNRVYKLYGPVLVKQDLEESRQNVGKRIEFIKKELKRVNDSIDQILKKQEKHKDQIQKLQQQFQVALAMK